MLSRTSHMSRVLHQPVHQLTRKIDVRGLLLRFVTIGSQLHLVASRSIWAVSGPSKDYPTTASACRTDVISTHVRFPMRSPSHWTRIGSGLVIVRPGTSSRRKRLPPRCSPFRLI